MTDNQLEALVRTLTILMSAYEPGVMPDPLDSESYIFGYRNGARQALTDVICRLREAGVDEATVTRIGAAS